MCCAHDAPTADMSWTDVTARFIEHIARLSGTHAIHAATCLLSASRFRRHTTHRVSDDCAAPTHSDIACPSALIPSQHHVQVHLHSNDRRVKMQHQSATIASRHTCYVRITHTPIADNRLQMIWCDHSAHCHRYKHRTARTATHTYTNR